MSKWFLVANMQIILSTEWLPKTTYWIKGHHLTNFSCLLKIDFGLDGKRFYSK